MSIYKLFPYLRIKQFIFGEKMFASIAYAAAPPAGGTGGAAGMVTMLMPLVLMVGIFYFLLIRPQQKRAKEHKAMLSKLQKGEYIMTSSGFLGRIVEVNGDIFSVDLGNTIVRIPRGFIQGTYDPKQLEKVASEAPETKA